MQIDIVAIGNSRGVRLPKAVLETCGFGEKAELIVRAGAIELRPVKSKKRKVREGWAEAISVVQVKADARGFADWQAAGTSFDEGEWTW